MAIDKELPIRFAPSDAAEKYAPQLNQVLTILGHSKAWVSDWSTIGDFTSSELPHTDEIARLSGLANMPVTNDTCLVDIAKALAGDC